jgi:ribose transport system substrate-binding protein
MKKHLLFSLFSLPIVPVLALVGCGNNAANNAAQTPGAANSTSNSTAGGGAGGAGGAKKISIAVIPKGTTHEFWKSCEAGARKAGAELGADIVFKGPVQESDRAGQIKIVEQFASEGTSAIVLAPLDEAALVKPVRGALAKKIPVVIIDSALKGTAGTDFASFVATDNRQGGVLAGREMVKILGGKGKVVLLRYQEGSASTQEREDGFLSEVKKSPGITVTVDNRYGGATSGEAKEAALNMVDRLREAQGVFAPNESSALGMLLALRQAGLAKKVKFVGFDASGPLLDGMAKGEINALVVQNPTKMGYEGVKTAVAALRGEKVAPRIDTGVQVVTQANRDTPASKEVLSGNQ